MELGGILLIIFLGVLTFLGECPTGSVAARLCPVRAEPVYPAQENGVVRCSCKTPFFGKNCRFKGEMHVSFSRVALDDSSYIPNFDLDQNGTVDVNGTRTSKELIIISWKEKEDKVEERRYLVSVRKIQHKLSGSVGRFAKWRNAAIQYTESDDKKTAYAMLGTTYTAVLRMPAKSSFEVKITTMNTAGDHLGSSSVYFDASDAFASGRATGQMLATSEKIQNIENYILESFQDESALKGIVVGAIVGSLGALMIMAFVYGLTRYCRKCKQQRGPGPDVESKQEYETKDVTSEDVETSLNIGNVSRTSSYIIIDMKDIETAPKETTAQTVPVESSKIVVAEKAYSPDNNSVTTGNTSQETTGASETVDIPETAIECDEPAEPEIVADNNTTRTVWDAYDYI